MKSPKARVLIVEDEAIVAKDIAVTLKGMSYHVSGTCATGQDAVNKATSGSPDIVLMDIMLPGNMDGIEAASLIQKNLNIPVVFLTAHADEATLSRAKAIAPYGYLIKPFADRELEVALETALYRSAMERKLHEQRQWVEAVLDCIGDAVIAADIGGNVIFMNPVAENLTGWSRKQAMGHPLSEVFHTIDELNRHPAESSEARALRDDTALKDEADNILLVSADGSERPIDTTVSPINDAEGNLLGIVAVFRDVTTRRQVEKRTLNRQKMEALGKLSSKIAHDFNNTVALIAGYASTMQDYLLPNTRAHDDIKRILTAVDHAGSLSKRILGVARASDTEGKLEIRPVMVGNLVESSVSLLHDILEKRNIRIQNNVPVPSMLIRADRNHFVDLLVDVILNSADAMEKGGKIAIDLRPYTLIKPDPKLNPHAKPGRYVTLRIKDSGAGMSRETLDRIFEPFFTTKATDTHVGLGLSVVHSAIQHYGGWIKVASEPKRGTTFSLFLPESEPDTQHPAARPTAAPSGSILIVDDDEATRMEIHDVLKQAGFKTHLAAGGGEAIALYNKLGGSLDLAIIDVVMPDQDGKAVLQEIMKINPMAAVIMLCGFSREHVRSYLPSGSWRFIQKPADPETILGAVRRSFEQKMS
jgi:two-component system cell cycle sensor histidine kinase/response regulator CckA